MRHLRRGRKLNRNSSHRTSLMRNMASSIFEHGRIITTPAKAKEARPFVEKLITLGKQNTLAARRLALAKLPDKAVVKQLFSEIAPRYAKRAGGYCRILKLDKRRVGDRAELCLFELVEEEVGKKRKKRVKAAVKANPSTEGKVDAPAAEEAKPAGDNAQA